MEFTVIISIYLKTDIQRLTQSVNSKQTFNFSL
jgi:hypothetical protein